MTGVILSKMTSVVLLIITNRVTRVILFFENGKELKMNI